MVAVWDGMWKTGARHDYGVGQHSVQNVGSFEIPEGFKACFVKGASIQRDTPYFFRGLMEAYHTVAFNRGGPYVLLVEETDVKHNQLCIAGWTWRDSKTSLDIRYAIPPGTWSGNDPLIFLPNDRIEWLEVPPSMAVTVYEHGGSQGSHRTYREGRHALPGGLANGVSTVVVELDGWKVLREDWDMEDKGDNIQQIGNLLISAESYNPSSVEVEDQVQLQASKECTITDKWELSSKVTGTVTVTGNAGVAEVAVGLSVETGGSYGQEETQNRGQALSVARTVKLAPGQSAKSTVNFAIMKGRFPGARYLENLVTHEHITEAGYRVADYAGRYKAYTVDLDTGTAIGNDDNG